MRRTTHTPTGVSADYISMRHPLSTAVQCERCDLPADYWTPTGPLCDEHTREAMDADPNLWMPRPVHELSEN